MSTFDPLDVAFRAGQELYKAGLLSLINARRQTRGRAPVGWPQVAVTPADVMWQEGNARLTRYRRDGLPPAAQDAAPPRLLAHQSARTCSTSSPSAASSGASSIAATTCGSSTGARRGAADATRPLADYALEQLPRAAAVVTERTGSDELHVLGYCMGGTLSLMAIAAGRLPAASLVAMATPVALHDEGLLSLWCRAPGFDPAELAGAYGNVPPHVLQPAFKMLDPVSLATKFVHLDGKVEDDDFIRFFLAMETWLEDSVAFPGRAFVDWVQLYRSDALAARRPRPRRHRDRSRPRALPDLPRHRRRRLHHAAALVAGAGVAHRRARAEDDAPVGRAHRPVDGARRARAAVAGRLRLAART